MTLKTITKEIDVDVDIDLDDISDDDIRDEAQARGLFLAGVAEFGGIEFGAAYESFRNNRLDKDQFLRDLFYSALGRIA